MAKVLMIQGTASNAGKSVLAAALCRIFKQDGYRVAPFKSQNMALNSYITPDGLEMGRAQVMQAEAAGIECDVRMNPILLKPTSESGSQVIVNGEVVGNMSAGRYYEEKDRFVPDIMRAFNSLCEEFDIVVIEGAGSPAEINLNHNDFVNMGMARLAAAPVLIVGDIDRGGVFASLYGTIALIEPENKKYIKGTIINKFRGDQTILEPGLAMLKDLTGVPVLGVVPYFSVKLDDEDSLTERFVRENTPALIDIAVIRLPRISNFTDFNALEYIEGVNVRYVEDVRSLNDPDLIILPGTKNTMGDLLWLRQNGLETAVKRFAGRGKPVLGVCGGYQMLGELISDPDGAEHGGTLSGMGLLPIETVFGQQKIRTRTVGRLASVGGIFAALSELPYEGYEIHMGTSGDNANLINSGNVYGTYIHGFFDRDEISAAVVNALLRASGQSELVSGRDIARFKEQQYDELADIVRNSLDMKLLYEILDSGIE